MTTHTLLKRCLVGLLVLLALAALLIGCLVLSPKSQEADWGTGNEVPCCPGDWDGTLLYTAAGGSYVTRTNVQVHSGSYSYEHLGACPDSACWAATYISCSHPITAGWIQAYLMFDERPGSWVPVLDYPVMSAGELWNLDPIGDAEGWTLYYDRATEIMRIRCNMCSPEQTWPLTGIALDNWHEFRVEWDLDCGQVGGQKLRAWQDGILYVDENNLSTKGCEYTPSPMNYCVVGIKDWHYWWGRNIKLWVDDVVAFGCDEPPPTPTPEPGACPNYGHAAVLNVSADCSTILRFHSFAEVPGGANITAASVRVYGVAVENPGETVYVTPLAAVWGETTTDWCRRTRGEGWVLPGATAVPDDREPGVIAQFQTQLGWTEIPLPVGVVEQWTTMSSANPGLVLFNCNMTGKLSLASREWYTDEYRPELVIFYED